MPVHLIPRPSQDRGNADHGWLKTFHTFSFADYYDPEHSSFGSLRVINEDRVQPGTGFGTHAHKEFEIWSYVVSGELEHRDSLGNVEILKRGDVQLTSAGTGVRHSEHTAGTVPVHFLQIWARPSTAHLQPAYYTRHFSDAEKEDKWAKVVAPISAPGVKGEREGEGPTPVHAGVTMYASLLSPGKTLSHAVPGAADEQQRKAYVHLIQTSGYNEGAAKGNEVRLTGAGQEVSLREGDGAYVLAGGGEQLGVENVGEGRAEVVLFDVDVE
ncbi:Pirin-domain-containing protein [Calocera viscosa TUFC12733]|uniref:Pirin-domain-containing protein n=1 Tax=Calocera viscosa (strain TUFC12733) TaxID=1330018 RepID=A0A167JGH7_CALVF|nr:Pirin-domain-containing protein [Calocera viscosa TUFC12733]